jgi:hypothetical protein
MSGANRHKCVKPVHTSGPIDRHIYKPTTNETNIKSDLIKFIVLFIARDMRPISIINGHGFRQLTQHLLSIGSKNPNIPLNNILPTNKTISNNIPHIYDVIKTNVINELQDINAIGMSCDHWKHDKTHKLYNIYHSICN